MTAGWTRPNAWAPTAHEYARDGVLPARNCCDRAARSWPRSPAAIQVCVATENWLEMTPDASSVRAVLEAAEGEIRLLIDLGNWTGPGKYEELAAIAPLAESCHAKCHFTADGPDERDFRRTLSILLDGSFTGPMALIYDGPDDDEWSGLDREWEIVISVLDVHEKRQSARFFG